MNRRALLFGASAIALGSPPPTAAQGRESAVARKYREWRMCFDEVNGSHGGKSDAETEAAADLVFVLADEMLDVPSDGPMDLIYKLMAYTLGGETDPLSGVHGYKIYAEARTLIEASSAREYGQGLLGVVPP